MATVAANPDLGTYAVIISNATPDNASAVELQNRLMAMGYKVFQQQTNRFSKDSSDWKREWLPNAQGAQLIVCLVSPPYLNSDACAEEFAYAENQKKIMVVALEPSRICDFKTSVNRVDVRSTLSASRPVMWVGQGGQLTAWDQGPDAVANEIAKVLVSRGVAAENVGSSSGSMGSQGFRESLPSPLNKSKSVPARSIDWDKRPTTDFPSSMIVSPVRGVTRRQRHLWGDDSLMKSADGRLQGRDGMMTREKSPPRLGSMRGKSVTKSFDRLLGKVRVYH